MPKQRITLTLTPEVIAGLKATCPKYLSFSQHLEAMIWAATENHSNGVIEAKERGYSHVLPATAIAQPEDYKPEPSEPAHHWEPMFD